MKQMFGSDGQTKEWKEAKEAKEAKAEKLNGPLIVGHADRKLVVAVGSSLYPIDCHCLECHLTRKVHVLNYVLHYVLHRPALLCTFVN